MRVILRNMSKQPIVAFATLSLAWWINLFLAFVTPVASWPGALIVALIDLSIGIAKLDSDIPLQLVLKSYSLHS